MDSPVSVRAWEDLAFNYAYKNEFSLDLHILCPFTDTTSKSEVMIWLLRIKAVFPWGWF